MKCSWHPLFKTTKNQPKIGGDFHWIRLEERNLQNGIQRKKIKRMDSSVCDVYVFIEWIKFSCVLFECIFSGAKQTPHRTAPRRIQIQPLSDRVCRFVMGATALNVHKLQNLANSPSISHNNA